MLPHYVFEYHDPVIMVLYVLRLTNWLPYFLDALLSSVYKGANEVMNYCYYVMKTGTLSP